MSILLPAMDHMFADGFQLFVNFVGLDHVRAEGVAKGGAHSTHDAVL